MARGDVFAHVYRGRQGDLHHMAYLRMSKVLLALGVLERMSFDLASRSILDYGFGAGTFFRYCPTSARLFGVETDPENVSGVREMLERRGHRAPTLAPIDAERWSAHPLLERRYDLVLCSHVLEHLREPLAFLSRLRACLDDHSLFLGLVPINERRANPEHVHAVDRATVESWADGSGHSLELYVESDPWTYWLQPFFTSHSGPYHRLAQVFSLALGVPATLLGPGRWEAISPAFAKLTRSEPTQAAFVLKRRQSAPSPPAARR